ncbi:hypothetical protein C0J52_03818 [Blattella germanica]|nr:hypothetical protein C0J52_03818 [Blattella germanica]
MAGKKVENARQRKITRLLSGSEDEANIQVNIQNMLTSILTEIKDLRKDNEEFRNETKKDIADLKEEIKGFDNKIEEKCNNLENKMSTLDKTIGEKVNEMEKKIRFLEETEERRQKRERRNKIIIKRQNLISDKDEDLNAKVSEILTKIQYEDSYTKISYIGKDKADRDLVRVELKSLKDKITIMRNKSKLAGSECYIDDDLTVNEREIQSNL